MMKHQQVTVDYWAMVKTSFIYLLLAFSGYVLMKLIQTIFWLPKHLNNNQKLLEDLASKYSVDLNELSDELNKETEAELKNSISTDNAPTETDTETKKAI